MGRTHRLRGRRDFAFRRRFGCGRKRHGSELSTGCALRGEPPAIGADDGNRLVTIEVERDGVHDGRAARVAPGDDGDAMARHEITRIENPAQRLRDGVHRAAGDAMAVQDAAQRIVAPHCYAVAVLVERDLCQRNRTSKGDRGAVRRVAAVRAPRRLNEPALPGPDADCDRDAPLLTVYSEQEPHLAAYTHVPQVRLLLDRLTDPVGVHGAHAGPVQQDRQAVATPNAKGLKLRRGLALSRRGRKRCLHRRGHAGRERRDHCERRNAAYPAPRLAIHTSNNPLHRNCVHRFVDQERR